MIRAFSSNFADLAKARCSLTSKGVERSNVKLRDKLLTKRAFGNIKFGCVLEK